MIIAAILTPIAMWWLTGDYSSENVVIKIEPEDLDENMIVYHYNGIATEITNYSIA